MIRGLAASVIVILAVIAAGFVAQRLTSAVSDGVLAGTIRGHLGVAVHFTVTESGASESPGGSRTDSKTQRRERVGIGMAIDEALCRKSIGEVCPP